MFTVLLLFIHRSLRTGIPEMPPKRWISVNKILTLQKTEKVFRKSDTLDFIAKLDLRLTQQGQEAEKPFEALKAFVPFFRYYQIFGFFPISIGTEYTGIWLNKRSPLWIITAISLAIQFGMTIRAFREVTQAYASSSKASEKVAAANSMAYYVHILSMTLIMIYRLPMLPGFFEGCKKVEFLCKRYQKKDDHLLTHCWLVFGLFISMQLTGNALYYYSIVAKNNVTSYISFTESFPLDDEQSVNTASVGIVGLLLGLFEFFCDCGWTFGDSLIALTATLLAKYFSRLNLGIEESRGTTVTEVENLRKDHRAIKDLVEHCNKVFSPIFLVNYIGNISYLLTRLYTGISDDIRSSNSIVRIESIYAFSYQVSKIMIPTWLAALLNEKAAVCLDNVHDWPSLIDKPDTRDRMMVIGRFVSQIINDPVGLSGCGYFTITKSFMITLISGIMTYEVIILQFQQSGF